MKNLKKLFLPLFMALVTSPVFADSIGFISVHNGFWWWVLAVVIAIVGIFVDVCAFAGSLEKFLIGKTYFIEFALWICFVFVFPITGTVFGFFLFPTVWCGALGAFLAFLLGMTFLYCFLSEPIEKSAYLAASFLYVTTVAAEVFAAIFLPQSWWLWKYFAVAAIGIGIANIIAFACEKFDRRKFIKKTTPPELITKIAEKMYLNPGFIKKNPKYQPCFNNHKEQIMEKFHEIEKISVDRAGKKTHWFNRHISQINKICRRSEKLAEEIFLNPDFVKKNPEYESFFNNRKEQIMCEFNKLKNSAMNAYHHHYSFRKHSPYNKERDYQIEKRTREIYKEDAPKYIEKIANGLLNDSDFVSKNSKNDPNYEFYFNDYKEQILARMNELKKEEITKELKAKEEKREEQNSKETFEKALKKVTDDVDAIELSLQKNNFNVLLLSELEKHISALSENKNLLSQKYVSVVERKAKYLEVIFTDCKKNPSCTGSATIRMDEILKMLKNICGNL